MLDIIHADINNVYNNNNNNIKYLWMGDGGDGGDGMLQSGGVVMTESISHESWPPRISAIAQSKPFNWKSPSTKANGNER